MKKSLQMATPVYDPFSHPIHPLTWNHYSIVLQYRGDSRSDTRGVPTVSDLHCPGCRREMHWEREGAGKTIFVTDSKRFWS